MIILSYILFPLFIILSIIHLYFCYKENEKWRKITKPTLLLTLGLAVLFYSPSSYLLYIACFFCFVGDIFLLFNKNEKIFVVGGTLFLVAHLIHTYLLISRSGLDHIHFSIYIILGILTIVFGLLSFFLIKPYMKNLDKRTSYSLYVCFLFINAYFGIVATIITYNPLYLLILLGYIFYLISDTTLFITTFHRDIPRRDFPIMLTYLLAELSIVLGFILTLNL